MSEREYILPIQLEDDGLLAIVVNSPTYDNGDPNHVHYLEEETLASLEFEDVSL